LEKVVQINHKNLGSESSERCTRKKEARRFCLQPPRSFLAIIF
jgi:hypothetical protein